MNGILLEGITGSGKTRLFGHLQRILADRARSNTKILLGEHYTERVLEHLRDGGTLTPEQVLAHLHGVLNMLDALRSAKAASKLRDRRGNATVLVVMERFAISQIAAMALAEPAACLLSASLVEAIAGLYQRADACGLKTVVLRVAPSAIGERVLSTTSYRNAAWRSYLARSGDDEAIVRHHTALQDALCACCRTLQGIVRPEFIDVAGACCEDEYASVAHDLARRFLAR